MPASRRSLRRLVALVGALLLVPLVTLLGAAPAQAEPNQLTGAVYDGLGDPLVGVTVEALALTGEPTGISTTTSAEGTYTLALSAGSYRLRFSQAGYETTTYGPGAVVAIDGAGLASVLGELITDNVLDQVSLVSQSTYPISGTVVKAGGTPLAGIAVAIYPADDEATPLQTTTTDAGGGYAFTQPAGVYHVQLTDPDHRYLSQWYGGTSRDITVSASTLLGQTTLDPVPADAEFPVAGRVVDANGEPVSGVTVAIDHVGGSTDTGTDLTDASGDYSASVLPGTYRVTFTRTGWTGAQYGNGATITVAADGTVWVLPAETLTGNRLSDQTLASTPFAVPGTVSASGGSAIAGITVRAFPSGSTDVAEVVDTASSGVDGGYTLDLPVGTYDLELVDDDPAAPTYQSGTMSAVRVGQDGSLTVAGTPVTSLPGAQLPLSDAGAAHPVTGGVVDALGDDVDGLSVTAVPQGSGEQASATTGADGDHGRFRLMLKPGSYVVHVAGGSDWLDATYLGGGVDPASVSVRANGTVWINGTEASGGDLGAMEVAGRKQFALIGTVTDGSTGLAGITVTATPADGSPATTTTSADDGTFAFTGSGTGAGTGLPVGAYTLRFTDDTSHSTLYQATTYGGNPPTEVTIDQAGRVTVDGTPVTIDVTMLPVTATTRYDLAGTVFGVDPANPDDPFPAIDGVTVTATPVAGTGADHLVTGSTANGAYQLPVQPGSYRLGFAKSGYTPTALTDLEDGSVATVTVGPTGAITIDGADAVEGAFDVQMLLTAAAFATAPRLSGVVAVGQIVQTTVGTLQGASTDPEHVTISWFLDGAPADAFSDGTVFQRFKVPASAAGKKLSYTISIDDPDGMRTASVYTSPAFPVPYLATVTAVARKGILTLTLSARGAPAPVGTIVLKEGRKTVGKATLTARSKGKAVIRLTKLTRGKHRLVVVFGGGGGYGPSHTTIAVKL